MSDLTSSAVVAASMAGCRYRRLGYDLRAYVPLRFQPDELTEMYACLQQVVPCKAIVMDKKL